MNEIVMGNVTPLKERIRKLEHEIEVLRKRVAIYESPNYGRDNVSIFEEIDDWYFDR